MTISKASKYLYILGLCVFAASLPLSKTFLTLSQIALGLAWLLHTNYKEKKELLIQNRILWWFPALLLLHFTFLYNTENFDYAWRDIVIKAPLFVIPFILASMPKPSRKELCWVIGIFIAAVLSVAIIGISMYLLGEWQYMEKVTNFRYYSPFVSHIRFSLMAVFVITLLVFAYKEKFVSFWLALPIVITLVIHLIIMESITGIGILLIIGLPLFMKLMGWRYKKDGAKILYISSILAAVVGFFILYEAKDIFIAKDDRMASLQKTAQGNDYMNDEMNTAKENGYYIYRYICYKELHEEWDKRKTKYKFSTLNPKDKGYLEGTLIRYLTSLGYKKDAEGLKKLSDEDIANIEIGEANAKNVEMNPIRKRIRELLWETDAYISNPSPGGNSLTQRFIFWKTGLDIVESYPLTGVGSGDVQVAFNKQFDLNKSPLDKEHRLHTHNQYITFWVSFGVFGLFFFLTMIAHLYIFSNQLEFRFVSQMFTIIMILSMISEDTLETQAGVSLFVFFFSLFWTRQSSEE
jgi:hypothetical protein